MNGPFWLVRAGCYSWAALSLPHSKPLYVNQFTGGVAFTFRRAFDVCRDGEDYVIEEGTTHLVWSAGRGPLFGLAGLNLADRSNTANGFARVRQVHAGDFLLIVVEGQIVLKGVCL